jgi:hypothetical protein
MVFCLAVVAQRLVHRPAFVAVGWLQFAGIEDDRPVRRLRRDLIAAEKAGDRERQEQLRERIAAWMAAEEARLIAAEAMDAQSDVEDPAQTQGAPTNAASPVFSLEELLTSSDPATVSLEAARC